MVENIVGKGEMLVTGNFSSPTIFFKRLFPRERDNSSLYEKGLTLSQTSPGFYVSAVQAF